MRSMTTTVDKRATRRFCLAMKKNQCKRIVKDIWCEKDLTNDEKFIGRMAQTPHPCSCPCCCGNPRHCDKGDGRTLQERRSEDVSQR